MKIKVIAGSIIGFLLLSTFALTATQVLAADEGGYQITDLADPLVEQGKTELFENNDPWMALYWFNEALEENPNSKKANFWRAVVTIFNNNDFQQLLKDAEIIDSSYNWLIFDANGHFDYEGPTSYNPALVDLQNNAESLLEDIDAALANLAIVNADTTFVDDAVDVPSMGEIFYLDYGDSKALETLYYMLKVNINIACSYDTDTPTIMDLVGIENPQELLSLYTSMANPLPDAGAKMAEAKTALENAISSYMATSEFIRARNDNYNHLVMLYEPYDSNDGSYEAWERRKTENLEREALARENFQDIYNNLTDHANHPYYLMTFPENADNVEQIPIDLYELFTDPMNLRAYVDEFTSLMIGSTYGNVSIITDNLSEDAQTLGGIVPDMTTADWNHLLSNCAKFDDDYPIVRWDDADNPSVELKWYPTGRFSENFLRYEIYRSTTPDVDQTSELVTTISDYWTPVDANSSTSMQTYTDSSIDGLDDVYYYCIYSYYDFGVDGTAQTRSSIGKATLRLYVDGSYIGGAEDGSREHPYNDLEVAIENKASSGTKIRVAEGTYNESAKTIWLGNKVGLVLEGGYESINWTRDIEANETIIDGSDLDYSTLSIYNTSDIVVDGFTITGADAVSGSWTPPGVHIHDSTDVVVKNCKIINNIGAGIEISNNATAEILDNIIDGNGEAGIKTYDGGSGIIITGNTITNNAAGGQYNLAAVSIHTTPDVEIKDCIIKDNYDRGIEIVGSNSSATIFNNLITTNANDGIRAHQAAYINIRNNTIAYNQGAYGIHYSYNVANAEIKNNIVFYNRNQSTGYGILGSSRTVSTTANNNSFHHPTGDYSNCGSSAGYDGNISENPLFTTGPGPVGFCYLSQVASGQTEDSPSVDTGSDTALSIGFTNGYTTRTDTGEDTGTVDMGYHYFLGPNLAPTAVIDSVSPNPVVQGQAVALTGHGEDADGSINAYSWRTDIDGDIGTTAVLSISTLSAGVHTIYFKVQDNMGAWSDETSQTLKVNGYPIIESVSYEGPDPDGWYTFTTRVSDSSGADTIKTHNLIIGDSAGKRPRIVVSYNADRNRFYLLKEWWENSKWQTRWPYKTIGQAGILDNGSTAMLDCGETIRELEGNDLTIRWKIKPYPCITGTKKLFLFARDEDQNRVGYVEKGTIDIPNQPPEAVSVSYNGPDAEGYYTIMTTVRDRDTGNNIKRHYLIIGPKVGTRERVYLLYLDDKKQVRIRDEVTGAYIRGKLGEDKLIGLESGCKGILDCKATALQINGNDHTMIWRVKFKDEFTALRNLHIWAMDYAGAKLEGNWVHEDGWTMLENSPPEISSLNIVLGRLFLWIGTDQEDGEPLYQYKVDDAAWSLASGRQGIPIQEVSQNLMPGAHTFYVRAVDSQGKESEVKSIQFMVN
ncbi:MAG: right-handed parallel beta-helix repeat-containing protein [Candidatus Omnitrophica bacterium]|nr:right-handed parallel beta-helix repeat-containing protein [Candidatus Omnitrophota bacterium]